LLSWFLDLHQWWNSSIAYKIKLIRYVMLTSENS
jgi:hypothetical protein